MSRLIIIGSGGHGKVVSEATQHDCVFLDDNLESGTVGAISELPEIQQEGDLVFVAIGDNEKRVELLSTITNVETVIHPTAIISPSATLGDGTIVCAGAIVQSNSTLGKGCIVNTGATVDHDCVLEDGVHVSPGSHVGGNVSIGACSWVGIGASVKNGITIGERVVVGAGAAVIKDIPNGITVVGVPAKEVTVST